MQVKVKEGDDLVLGVDTFTYRALEPGALNAQRPGSPLPGAEARPAGTSWAESNSSRRQLSKKHDKTMLRISLQHYVVIGMSIC
jgi:hypothetical protein